MLLARKRAHRDRGGGGFSVVSGGHNGPGISESEDRERRAEEFAKLCFEYFKHLTTLSTAGAVVVLAVYRELTVGTVLLAATLVLFGVTILTCVISMMACTTHFSSSPYRVSERNLGWLMAGASISFVTGVESFMPLMIQLPNWANFVLLPVVVLILVWLTRRRLAWFRGDRRTSQAQTDQKHEQASRGQEGAQEVAQEPTSSRPWWRRWFVG